MCLYPRTIKNRKYTENKKNGGIIPNPPVIIESDGNWQYDTRVLTIQAPCGQCIECRQEKAREWQIRLGEELKDWKYAYFMTLTFSPEGLREILYKLKNSDRVNLAAEYAVRHMLERWRKKHGVSLKHWFITELGHNNTERIHIHGVIFDNKPIEFGEPDENNFRPWKYWKYGFVFVGEYCTQRTINYIVKYVTKIDKDHKDFKALIMASPGIGKGWLERNETQLNVYRYRPHNTIDYFILDTGARVKQPTYYKNKLHGEEEKETIWREKMDLEQNIIAGNIYTKDTDYNALERITNKAREKNKEYGYGDNSKEWKQKEYNINKRWLQHQEREKQKEIMQKAVDKYNREQLKMLQKGKILQENLHILKK